MKMKREGTRKGKKKKKLCKVLNVKTISFAAMSIGWEAEGSEDGREGSWLGKWTGGDEGRSLEGRKLQ